MNALALALASLALTAPERPWTFLVYGAADNNADGPILEFLDSVRTALDDDAGVELVLFIDRSKGYSNDATSLGEDFTDARIYRLRKTTAERIDPGAEFPELAGPGEHEVDSGDPGMLGRFVNFAKKRFPARHYGLMIYSHADGRGMCPDEESKSEMRIPELRDRVGPEASVDFLGLELCNMGGIEVGYEWRPGNGGFSARVLVAIPNAGPPLDWDRAFARVRTPGHGTKAAGAVLDPAKMTAEDLGKLVIEEGRLGRQSMIDRVPEMAAHMKHEAAACCDLSKAADVKKAVDALAVVLAQKDPKKTFLEVRGPGAEGKTIDYAGGGIEHSPYFDLYDLCSRAVVSDALPKECKDAARAVGEAVDRFVLASFGMEGIESFEQDKSGVFIVFPGEKAWQKFRWYSPLAAGNKTDPYGSWAFLKDGATPGNGVVENWYELLASWFDPNPNAAGYRW